MQRGRMVFGLFVLSALVLIQILAPSTRASSAVGGQGSSGGTPGVATWALQCNAGTGSVTWSWLANATGFPVTTSSTCGTGPANGTSSIPSNATGISTTVDATAVCIDLSHSVKNLHCNPGSKTVVKSVDPAKGFTIRVNVSASGESCISVKPGLVSCVHTKASVSFGLTYAP